jgi:hypothetical protein
VVNDGSGVMTFQACDFDQPAPCGARTGARAGFGAGRGWLGAEVTRARLLGFDEKAARIRNAATDGDVMVSARNPYARRTEEVSPTPMTFPRPASDALFVVTDFGASPTNADNAAAFQAALDAAGKDGGTVYVPAGLYAFHSDLTVPTGVELRGCSGVPHHTISAGSVLLVYHNKGVEDGTPFIGLRPDAGMRGLTVWYPEQPLKEPVPYPWTVQSLGKACWLTDVTIGNAWQGVDFASHRSDGHRISYLAGSMYRRGLFVGNTAKSWVEDVQRTALCGTVAAEDAALYTAMESETPASILSVPAGNLEASVFRGCATTGRGTFLTRRTTGSRSGKKSRAGVDARQHGAAARVFDTQGVRGSVRAGAIGGGANGRRPPW